MAAERIHEQAWLYVLGDLSGSEREAFEAQLDASPELVEAVREASETLLELELAQEAVAAPEALRERMLALPEFDASSAPTLRPGFAFLDWKNAKWQVTPLRGVLRQRLYHDEESGLTTYLLRLKPKAGLPPHYHPHAEQCWVLEGEITSEGMTARAGDFFVAGARTTHSWLRSEKGCLLLIIGPEDLDFRVADPVS